jgi:hypothetical protein
VDTQTGAIQRNLKTVDLKIWSNFVASFVTFGVDEATSTFFSYFKFSTSAEKRWFSYNLLTEASVLTNLTEHFLLDAVANK